MAVCSYDPGMYDAERLLPSKPTKARQLKAIPQISQANYYVRDSILSVKMSFTITDKLEGKQSLL